MTRFDPNDSGPSALRKILGDARKELRLVKAALMAAVPRGGRTNLRSPHPFRWPDGRLLQFTALAWDGDHVFLVNDGTERARIDLLSTDELAKIGAKAPGYQSPQTVPPDNVIRMPR